MDSIKKQARYAGLLYFLIAASAPIGLMLVPGRLIVSRDATATADHLRASEWLLRVGIASELLHQVLGIFLVLALYRLFKPVDKGYARLMVVMSLAGVPIMFLNVLNELAALTLVSGVPYLAAFDPRQLDALAYVFMRLHGQGVTVASVFWGLWLFPFGILALRSGFIPRVFGYLLFVAGIAYMASSTTSLVLPRFAPFVNPYALALEVAEVPIVFWLLIWGASTPKGDAQAAPAKDRVHAGPTA